MTAPPCLHASFFFFFNDTATTEIYPLSLHDALPILRESCSPASLARTRRPAGPTPGRAKTSAGTHRGWRSAPRSEEHTSELQSRLHLVCRLLLEKKKYKASA